MTDQARPAPLTPPECDLRDFPFMPLDIARLRRSKAWLKAKRNPALAFYLINLWTASWHDVPAASLEDDDDVLADLAMCEPSKWSKVREEVLRGWVKASDDRLYHPTVAEKALEAWKAKLSQRARTEAARLAKEQKRQQALSQAQHAGSVAVSVTGAVTGAVTEAATASKGEGQGEREGQGQGDSYSVPTGTGGADAPPADDPKLSSMTEAERRKTLAWRGAKSLLNVHGMPMDQTGAYLGALHREHKALGDDVFLGVLERAVLERPAGPEAWIKAAFQIAAGQRQPTNKQAALEASNDAVVQAALAKERSNAGS